jgi:hypothetical protein
LLLLIGLHPVDEQINDREANLALVRIQEINGSIHKKECDHLYLAPQLRIVLQSPLIATNQGETPLANIPHTGRHRNQELLLLFLLVEVQLVAELSKLDFYLIQQFQETQVLYDLDFLVLGHALTTDGTDAVEATNAEILVRYTLLKYGHQVLKQAQIVPIDQAS